MRTGFALTPIRTSRLICPLTGERIARLAAKGVRQLSAVAAGLALVGVGPAVALADSDGTGGSGLTGSSGLTGTGTGTTSVTATVPPPIDLATIVGTATTSGRNIQLSASSVSQSGARLALQGKAGNSARRVVQVQYKYSTSARWRFAAGVVTGRGGSFSAHWRVPARGSLRLRAVLLPVALHAVTASVQSTAAAHGPATPTLEVTVLRSAIATYYGNKSLWGHETYCGETLSATTIGVASRTLPCGTQVTIYFRGHELVAPVIDRGPYANGASWDLTKATASALGILELGRVTIGTRYPTLR
jgi:rare lipoprotein A (peptidoglycan hydrolase)